MQANFQKKMKKSRKKTQHKRIACYLAISRAQAVACAQNTSQQPFWRPRRPPSEPQFFFIVPKKQENAHPGVYD